MALSVELNQAHRWFVAKCVRQIIVLYNVIACCYGVARFIVQNKQATTLWSGSRDLYQV